MAGSINSVTLIGNVGRDPEVRSFQNGNRVANLRLATSETWKDKTSGERKESTEWHTVAVFNDNIIRIVEAYVRRGSKIAIHNAALQTRKWQDQSGNDRYSTEVVIQRFRGDLVLLDKREDGGGQQQPAHEQGGSYADDLDDVPFGPETR